MMGTCDFKGCWEHVRTNNTHRECWNCVHNPESKETEKKNNLKDVAEKVTELYEYLIGDSLPEGVRVKSPKLSTKAAFEVIWFLQEIVGVLPSNIEQCKQCGRLFDSDCEGYHIDDDCYHLCDGGVSSRKVSKKYYGSYCDNCIPISCGIK